MRKDFFGEYLVPHDARKEFEKLGGVIKSEHKLYCVGVVPREAPLSGFDRVKLACGHLIPGVGSAPRDRIIYCESPKIQQ